MLELFGEGRIGAPEVRLKVLDDAPLVQGEIDALDVVRTVITQHDKVIPAPQGSQPGRRLVAAEGKINVLCD